MEYNRVLELAILKFLRVRIGQQFTPDELFAEAEKMAPTTKENFLILIRILAVEELIETSSTTVDDAAQLVKIVGITKEGLQLLRNKKQ